MMMTGKIKVDLSDKRVVHPMTLVYLVRQGRVFLLKRNPDKDMVPGQWLGVGGKVEPGEDLFVSAARECREEAGVDPLDLQFRGTFTYVSQRPRVGVLYLFTATSWSGELRADCEEGTFAWHAIDGIATIPDLATHQEFFLPRILTNPTYVFSGFAVYQNGLLLHRADSDPYFAERRQR
jgi:8-oxo-dGTP diphosphatase